MGAETGPAAVCVRPAPQVDVPRRLLAHDGVRLVARVARVRLAVVGPLAADAVVLGLCDDAVLRAALLLRLLPAAEGLGLQVVDLHGPVPGHVDDVEHGAVAELRPGPSFLRPVVLLVRATGLAPCTARPAREHGRGQAHGWRSGQAGNTHRGAPACPWWRPRSWGVWRCGTPSTATPRCPRPPRSTSACPCSRRRGRRAGTRRWCTGTGRRGRAAPPPPGTRTRCPTRSWARHGTCRCGRGRRGRGPACWAARPPERPRARARTATWRAC